MNIGLVAHDSKKTLMQNFCIAYRGILSKHELYATGTTGRLIEEVTNLNVHKYLAGPLGGKEQLGAQIAQNDIDASAFSCIILRIRPSFSQADRLSYSIHSACVVGIRIPQIEHTASSD